MNGIKSAELALPILKSESRKAGLSNDIPLPYKTTYFSDRSPSLSLSGDVFPHIMKHSLPGMPLRIWIPGCGTGEYVYSLAMSLQEYLEDEKIPVTFTIFATDENEEDLRMARSGIYPDPAGAGLSPSGRNRFFTPAGEGYQVNSATRDSCLFALHDPHNDPAYANIDLICMGTNFPPVTHAGKMMGVPDFYHALRPEGLLIDATRTADRYPALFSPVKSSLPLYRKKRPVEKPVSEFILCAMNTIPESACIMNEKMHILMESEETRRNNPAAVPREVPLVLKTSHGRDLGSSLLEGAGQHPLQKELATTRAYFQSVIIEKEAEIEELHASISEIQSLNEELQATRSHQEALVKELQSALEEMKASNADLKLRNSVLTKIN